MFKLHDQFVFVLADIAENNIVFVCKAHYIGRILEELWYNSASDNPTYMYSSRYEEEILQNHISTFNIFYSPRFKINLNYLVYIGYLNFIKSLLTMILSGFQLMFYKTLSLLLTKILTAVKEEPQEYCATVYSRSSVNHM